MPEPAQQSIFFIPCTTFEITDIISNMKSKNSMGVDNLIKHEITYPIYKLINQSLELGAVPDRMKVAKIFPIYI